jgi:hypothetical protein
MDARSPLYPAVEDLDIIEDALTVIRTLTLLPALLPEPTQEITATILSVVNHYSDEALTSARNVMALLQSL